MITLENVSYCYPFHDRPVLQEINLQVAPGELLLVTGASGCGKSTLIRLMNGLCPHFFKGELQGSVTIDGQKSSERSLQQIATDVGSVFQDPELQFFALGVEDELAFAHEWRGRTPQEIGDIIQSSAARMGITPLLASSIHDLSEGEKQKVALAASLSLQPKVLVLDEPTANLDPESTLELAQRLQELRAQGIAIVVVDHRLYWLREVADRVVVLKEGRIFREGPFSLLEDEALRRDCGLRRCRVEDRRSALPAAGGDLLQVEGLHFSYRKKSRWRTHNAAKEVFAGASFGVDSGVTAIIGDNGRGKTTLARLLTGLLKRQSGSIRLNGEQLSAKQILQRTSIVLQNTDHQLHMSSVLGELKMAAGGGRTTVNEAPLTALLQELNLDHLAERHPQSLSGGEKQRLVIACGLVKQPQILILDEPTSGLDGGNMAQIATLIQRVAAEGCIVLLITHDLELLEVCAERALRLPFPNTLEQEIQ